MCRTIPVPSQSIAVPRVAARSWPLRCGLLAAWLGAMLPSLGLATPEVWRCGPDGRSYSDAPCANGRTLPTLAPRPAADLAQARRLAVAEQQQAQTLRHERLQREAQWLAANARPVSLGPERAAARPVQPAPKSSPSKRSPHRSSKRPPADDGTSPAAALSIPRKRG